MAEHTAHDGTSRRGSARASVYLASAAIALSLSASAMVLGNVAAGVPPQPDEDNWAHLFQLAMVAQVPLLALFLATADWFRTRSTFILLAAQLSSVAAAVGALWWSGY